MNRVPGLSESLGHERGQAAPAGDETDGRGRRGRVGQDGQCASHGFRVARFGPERL